MSDPVDIARDPLVWRTANFVMRPLEPADAPEMLALFSDPAVVEFMDIDPLEDLEDARDVIDWACGKREDRAGVRWAIRPDAAGPLIGTCGFNMLERARGRRGEVAYDLARAHWGRGVMSEVLPPLLDFGFRALGLRRIEAMVTTGNDRSARLLRRHGFTREATLREHGFWKGRFWDQEVFACFAAAPPAAARAPLGPPRSDGVILTALSIADAPAVLALYRAAAAGPGGLARRPEEMDLAYVEGFLRKAAAGGLALGAWMPQGELCGEIHAGRIGPAQFDHVLSDLTVAVDPGWQGRGVGSHLFRGLFAEAAGLSPRVQRVELMAREGNAAAVRLYERLGFRIEGRFEGRVRRPDGRLEADLAMGLTLPVRE